MRETLRFQTNIPEIVALAFDGGLKVEGRYGDQVMFTLDDDRVMYVPPIVEDHIRKLGIRKGEEFRVTKGETKEGNRRSIQWAVERAPELASSPAPKAKDEAVQEAISDQSQPTTNGNMVPLVNGNGRRPVTKLEDALKTVIAAVHASREYAREIGFEMPVFTAEDLRTMANTLMIEGRNGGPR